MSCLFARRVVLLAFICLLSRPVLHAIDKTPITRLGIQQGLSNNSIRCIYQDHKGLMWFGTYDGLNLYDGYNFTVFRNKLNDSTSLPHNYIYAIHEDKRNNLWIGTGQGIAIYNGIYSRFKPAYYQAHATKEIHKISININVIKSDSAGNVFMGSNGWGLLIKREGEEIARQIPIIEGKQERTGYNVQSLSIDKQGRVWMLVLDYGLCVYDYSRRSIRLVNSQLTSGTALAPDNEGGVWVATVNGLYKYSMPSNSITEHHTETSGELTTNRIVSLFYDAQKNLWIGTEGGGVNILNNATKQFEYILPGESKDALSSESVFAIYSDNESRMWMGTIKGGINIIDPQKGRFQTVTHQVNERNSLVNNFVSAFYETKNGELLVGTDGGGISAWNRQQNIFTNFTHQAIHSSSLSNNSVSCIREDFLGDIWVATFGGGVNRFNRAKGTFEHFRCINDSTGMENNNAWLMYEDRDKDLWATTFGNGKLYRFNREANRFIVFTQQLNNLIAMTEDHAGTLWAGNAHQLIRIDKQNKQHLIYEIGKPIRALFEDSRHNLWVGTEGGGLILFDRQSGKIAQRYSDADGLSNNGVLNILEDKEGYLWLSTFNGLSRFDLSKKVFKNFYESDGLQSNQFSYNAALRLRSGELVFGGINGFSLFYPANITFRKYMPAVLFTGIWINNKPGADAERYIINKPGDDRISELRVPFNQAVLSFHFTALEYTSPEKIRYAYYLEGWDKGWNYTDNIRAINYNNISEGNYILRVKSTNAEGEWNSKEAVIKVKVLPPWYRAWWAYVLYVSVAGALVFIYFRYKARQAKLEYEIKLAHINAEKEKEINEKRQSFFTNISHEFRTPLTLIINPVKDLLEKESPDGKTKHNELNIVYRNARRLLSLVDQLLLFRKAENKGDQLNITKLNFYELCREVWLCFLQQARSRNIEYLFEAGNEHLEIYADRDKMEIIFYNLLSNALKYTSEGGKVIFRITEMEDTVEAAVIDNGYGIPAEMGDRVFEKFYQVKDKSVPSKPGFGIGLYLVRQFVDKHNGQISYTSQPGEGTSFYISLQKGRRHFGNIEIGDTGEDNSHLLLDEILAGNEPVEAAEKNGTNGLESIISEKQSILITDDNEQMRSYLVQVFQQRFIVYEAGNGDEGLKIAKEFQPDIIISDVVMQQMTGIEFCKAVKESPTLNHIPFILITGSFSPESKLKGIEYGADDYITKPFEKDLLVARVESLIRKHQNLQKYFYNEITHQKNSLNISGEYKEFLETCIAIVEKHLDKDEFNIQTLATEIGMSHSKLYKKIKAISGQSANAFIRFIRLRKAAEMFINTNYNINETAFYVGIKDIKYFREQFTKTFGLKPSEYIEKYRRTLGKNYKLNERVVKDSQ